MMKLDVGTAPRAVITRALLLLQAAAGCTDDADVHVLTVKGDVGPADTTPVTLLQPGTTVTREPIGAFVVLEERREREVIALHVAPEFPQVHLSFTSQDGLLNLALSDNGRVLSASAESPGCYAVVQYLQYAGCGKDEWHLYEAMLGSLGHLAQACGTQLKNPGQYRSTLDSASADFPAAMRVMKARAAVVFRDDLKRCKAPRMDGRSVWALPPCEED